MDRFKNYYDRLADLNKHSHDFEENSGLTVDLSANSNITRDYFAKADAATSNLLEFFHDNIERQSMSSILYHKFDFDKKRNNEDLKMLLFIDVIRCFEGLGHSTNLSAPEGIALLLLLSKAYNPLFFFNYESLSEIPECIINLDAIIPYIGECSDELGNKNDIILSQLLHEINPKADIAYRILLYRFCEAISEVDDKISLLESEWLKTILHLDDDNPDNDINIDSIFSRN